MKKIVLALALALSFVNFVAPAAASLTDGQKNEIITNILNGDTSDLDRLLGGSAPEARVACTMGCYSMSPNNAFACRMFSTVLMCSQQVNNLGCYWSCQ